MRLFNLMKGLFGKPADTTAPDHSEPEVSAPPTFNPLSARAPAVMPPALRATAQPIRITMPAPRPAPTAALSASKGELQLPLSILLSSLPVELQGRVLAGQIPEATVSFPLERILPQLVHGAVRVTFGEIRQAAPRAFTGAEEHDATEITLPLNELISRIAPTLMGRRAQKRVEVPPDITSPFGSNGLGLSLSQPGAKPELTSPRGAPSAIPVPPSTDGRARGNVTSFPTPAAPASVTNNGTAIFRRTTPPATPTITATAKPTHGNGSNGNGNGNGHHAAAPAPAPAAAALLVPLARLADAWPEAIRLEMAQLNLNSANTALPAQEVEAGLKRGKVSFTWKAIRAHIKPAPLPSVSAHDNLALDLPLAVLAPMFMAFKKSANGATEQRRVTVDAKIPDLFFGFPKPEDAPAAPAAPVAPVAPVVPPAPIAAAPVEAAPFVPAAEPADTNYFIWDDDKETGRVEGSNGDTYIPTAPSPGTNFLSRKATPNEVVKRATVLEGVYGAMVALPDGLLVAAKLDPSLGGDAVAALIPQMYSKLSGCTKELRMGELNNLNFTVGNVPWKIFRVNGLFFAAYGNTGEPLPTAELARLAAELDYRKAK